MSQMFSKSLEVCTKFAFFQSAIPKFGRNCWYAEIGPPSTQGSTGAISTAQGETDLLFPNEQPAKEQESEDGAAAPPSALLSLPTAASLAPLSALARPAVDRSAPALSAQPRGSKLFRPPELSRDSSARYT